MRTPLVPRVDPVKGANSDGSGEQRRRLYVRDESAVGVDCNSGACEVWCSRTDLLVTDER